MTGAAPQANRASVTAARHAASAPNDAMCPPRPGHGSERAVPARGRVDAACPNWGAWGVLLANLDTGLTLDLFHEFHVIRLFA